MSKDLPRFTASQQVGGAPIATPTGGAQALSQLGSRIEGFGAQQFVQQRAVIEKKQGEMAGLNPNFRPSTGGGIAGQAFNKAALAANKQMIGTDIITNSQSLSQQAAQSSPDAAVQMQNFNKSYQDYASQVFQNAPDENKPYVKNLLTYHHGTQINGFQKKVFQQQSIRGAAQYVQSNNAYHDQMVKGVDSINWNMPDEDVQKQVAATGNMLSQLNQNTLIAADAGFIDKNASTQQLKQNQDKFNKELIASQYKAKLGEGDGFANDFLRQVSDASLKGPSAGALKGLDIFQRQQLVKQLQSIGLQSAGVANMSSFALNQMRRDEFNAVKLGNSPNPTARSAWIGKHPGDAETYDQQIQNGQNTASNIDTLKETPLNDQKAVMDNLQPKPNDADFVNKQQVFKDTQQLLAKQNTEYSRDPVSFLKNNPGVVSAFTQKAAEIKSGVNFSTMQANGIKPLSQNPIEQLVTAQVMKGTPFSQVNVATDSQASNIANFLRGDSPTAEKISSLNNLSQTYGKFYPQLIQQMVKKDKLSPLESFITGIPLNDPNLPIYDQALNRTSAELEKQLKPEDIKTINGLAKAPPTPGLFTSSGSAAMSQFIQSHKDYSSTNTNKFLNNVQTFNKNVAFSLMNESSNLTAEDAFKKASDLIAGRFNYSSVGGKTIRVPKQFDVDAVKQYADEQKKKLGAFPFSSVRLSTGAFADDNTILKNSIEPGGWATNSTNDGLTWVKADGTALHDDKGNTFGFKFQDAVNNAPEPFSQRVSRVLTPSKEEEKQIREAGALGQLVKLQQGIKKIEEPQK